jgi:hypothetical protein
MELDCVLSFMLRPLCSWIKSPVGYRMDEGSYVLCGRTVYLIVTVVMVMMNLKTTSVQIAEDANLRNCYFYVGVIQQYDVTEIVNVCGTLLQRLLTILHY